MNKTYIGVFDGYDGSVASSKCASQLHLALLKNISKFDKSIDYEKFYTKNFFDEKHFDEINHLEKYEIIKDENEQALDNTVLTMNNDESNEIGTYVNNIKNAFNESYRNMDKLLLRGKNERSKVRWSGATAATCIIETLDNNKTWLHIANCGMLLFKSL